MSWLTEGNNYDPDYQESPSNSTSFRAGYRAPLTDIRNGLKVGAFPTDCLDWAGTRVPGSLHLGVDAHLFLFRDLPGQDFGGLYSCPGLTEGKYEALCPDNRVQPLIRSLPRQTGPCRPDRQEK